MQSVTTDPAEGSDAALACSVAPIPPITPVAARLAASRVDAEPVLSGWVVAGNRVSAGGLEALERCFGAIPADTDTDTGASFVVIQHLSPCHKSVMTNLLARLRLPRERDAQLAGGDLLPAQMEPLDAILQHGVGSSASDFREYTPTTVLRCSERRMQVLPGVLAADSADPIRVWVACCATAQRLTGAVLLRMQEAHDTQRPSLDAMQLDEVQCQRLEALARARAPTHDSLQSTIEELHTANKARQAKVDVLNSAHADLESIAKATAIPTLLVDGALRLIRVTPDCTRLFKVRDSDSDSGRSIEDFAHNLDDASVFTDLRCTLASGTVAEREVNRRDGPWWLARIQPASSCHGQRAGLAGDAARAVMNFVEVSALTDSQRLQAVMDALAEHVAVVDKQGTILQVHAAWRRCAQRHGNARLDTSGPGSNGLRVCAQAPLEDADTRRAHDGLAAVLQCSLPLCTLQHPCHTAYSWLRSLMPVAPVQHVAGGAALSHINVTAWAEGGPMPRRVGTPSSASSSPPEPQETTP